MNQVSVSLNELIHSFKKYEEHFKNIPKALNALEHYYYQINSSYCKGYYWLGGQIKLSPDDKIDEKLLIHTQKTIDQRTIDFPPCNSAEYHSVNSANIIFKTFLDIFVKYEDIYMHEMYRPPNENDPLDKGGLMYQKTLSETLVGKQIDSCNTSEKDD